MHAFFTDDMRRDPFPLYRELRESSPLFHFAPADLWMLFDHASVRQALSDHETFSSAASPPGSTPAEWMIFSDPSRHTKLRGLVSRAFTSRAVANLEPRIRELSALLLDAKLGQGEMDLVADFAVPLPLMVISEMLGAPLDDLARFRAWSDAMLGLGHSVVANDEAKAAEAAFGAATIEMKAYLERLIAERRATPRDDLLTRLVEAEVDGERLNDAELLGFFQLLLLAGHETTTNLISNAVLSFVEHPDQLERVRANLGLLPAAIEEVLRHRSPVQAVFRVARRELELHGRRIPAGSLILPIIGSANRDPRIFADADRFDISRDPNPHLAFGHGIHFCIGAPLARIEGRIALGDLLSRTRRIELVNDVWTPRGVFHVYGPAQLPIRFAPR
jgi:cytochrome P450